MQLSKPPETFVSALSENVFFFHPEYFVQFDEATVISNDSGFSQWAKEGIETKQHMLDNLSINRDMGNLKFDPTYDSLLKNDPIVNKGIKILHNHQGTTLPTRPTRIALRIANKRIISQQNN